MESAAKPVQGVRGRRGRLPMETKLAALQEWRIYVPGYAGGDKAQVAWLDQALQPPGSTQRPGHAGSRRVLCGIGRQQQQTSCPSDFSPKCLPFALTLQMDRLAPSGSSQGQPELPGHKSTGVWQAGSGLPRSVGVQAHVAGSPPPTASPPAFPSCLRGRPRCSGTRTHRRGEGLARPASRCHPGRCS